jgi:hypothetical protein
MYQDPIAVHNVGEPRELHCTVEGCNHFVVKVIKDIYTISLRGRSSSRVYHREIGFKPYYILFTYVNRLELCSLRIERERSRRSWTQKIN